MAVKDDVILLTGATGFIGSHLLQGLIDNSYSVIVLKRSTSDCSRIAHLLDQCEVLDLDKTELKRVFANHPIKAVVHLATQYDRTGHNIGDLIRTNLLLGADLLSASVENDVKLFINTDTFYAETRGIRGELDNYVISKQQFVEWIGQFESKIGVINMKLHHVYGENDNRDKFVPWLFREISNGNQHIKLTHGRQMRDFIYVKDVVAAYLKILENPGINKGFRQHVVCTGAKTSLREFCETLNEEVQRSKGVLGQLDFGAIEPRKNEIMDIENDNSSLLAAGWCPQFDLRAGMRLMISKELAPSNG